MLNEFKSFLLRGNVVDMAVGIMIGAAFSGVVTALVKGVFTPLIGAIVKVPDMTNLEATINGSVFRYGEFLNALISFVIVATVIFFFVVTPVNHLTQRMKKPTAPAAPGTKKCKECLSEIPVEAKRCAHCTQVQ